MRPKTRTMYTTGWRRESDSSPSSPARTGTPPEDGRPTDRRTYDGETESDLGEGHADGLPERDLVVRIDGLDHGPEYFGELHRGHQRLADNVRMDGPDSRWRPVRERGRRAGSCRRPMTRSERIRVIEATLDTGATSKRRDRRRRGRLLTISQVAGRSNRRTARHLGHCRRQASDGHAHARPSDRQHRRAAELGR